MKIPIHFNAEDERLIRDGYEEKHKKRLDESEHSLSYYMLPEYIKLGKKVKRQRAFSNFVENWGSVLFWGIAIIGFFGWSSYSNHVKKMEAQQKAESNFQRYLDDKKHNSQSSGSSTSGIYYSETCPITTCNDGACSTSTGRGTCSHHGGVRN